MKLIRFTIADSPNPCFGVVVGDQAVSFAVLQSKAGKSYPQLAESRSYLANLPESERTAKELLAWGEEHLGEFGNDERFPLNAVRLLEPVEVAALFDFGLTPRHLNTTTRNDAGCYSGVGWARVLSCPPWSSNRISRWATLPLLPTLQRNLVVVLRTLPKPS